MVRRAHGRTSMPNLRGTLAILAAVIVLGAAGADRVSAQAGAPAAPPPGGGHGSSSRPDTLQAGDAFGDEVTLPEQTIVYFAGSGKWDNAFETIVDGFK